MQQIIISSQEAGQRFDKFLKRHLGEAQSSFLYKMLRKKNITLNSRKADGSEKLSEGDVVELFFSDETYEKFRGNKIEEKQNQLFKEAAWAYRQFSGIEILYEDEHVLLVNKPAGVLSQKAQSGDLSLNEWLMGYLLEKKEVTSKSLQLFRPSVCNRLDRNTSGIVICGKSLYGSQQMSAMLKERSLHKYYLLYVEGQMREAKQIEGYLQKDEKTNKVTICSQMLPGSSRIVTYYAPVLVGKKETLVEVELITGKPHQIRAHLASIGFPLVGDYKYGNRTKNDERKRLYGISHQMLHAYRIVFPKLEGKLTGLSEKEITAPLPVLFHLFE